MKCPKCHSDNLDTQQFCGDCGTQLLPTEEVAPSLTKTLETPKEELTTGSTFAERYQIIEELGKGGMGKVYRALDKTLKEEVALKLIKPEIASDKKTLERFQNELKLARKIRHSNVGGMYELLDHKGIHYITMEYVSGEDLKIFIRRSGRLTVSKAVDIASKICEGLEEAHRLGVIHRDLKPSNIMIDKEGNTRIMDFGIARSLKEKGITGAGVMIGTPEYMSPEQVEAKEVDQRSDIYSLGIILYEMTTGRLPFEADTPFAVGIKQKSEKPESPQDINPQIPDDLSRVILKCLEKDKNARYQSAEEVNAELENIEKGIPTAEREIPKRKTITSKEITVSFSVKKLLIPSLVLVAVIITGLIIWRPRSLERAVPITSGKPSLAVVYFENNTGDESLNHWRKALCELLIADLTQSKYIGVLSSDRLIDILSDLEQMEARSLSSKVLRQVAARGGSTHILRGSYTRAGEQFRINAILQDASTMESIGSDRIEGKGEESFLSMVDELTRKVKAHFRLSEEEIAEDIDDDIVNITTASPEALKYYVEGRKYHLTRSYERSIELMEKAVAIDPEFAMAYRSMATSYGNIGFLPQRNKYMEKALELSSRLPARERFFIEAEFLSRSVKTYDKAIEVYEKLLELYPDDPNGNHNLAVRYSSLGETHKAIEHYEINRNNDDLSLLGYENLASVYQQVDAYDKAREVLEEALQKYPDKASVHAALSLHYQMAGKYDLALAEVNKAFALEPAKGTQVDRINFVRRAAIHFYKDDLVKAAEDYLNLQKQKRPQAIYLGSMGIVNLNLLQGKFKGTKDILRPMIDVSKKAGVNWPISEIYLRFAYIDLKIDSLQEALKDCDSAAEYALKAETPSRQSRALHLKGLVYLRMNSVDESLKTAEELRALILDVHNPQLMHFFQQLTGMIELKQNNFSQAIEHFKEAMTLQSSDPRDRRADYVESLARAYYSSGNMDEAQVEYERITSSSLDRLDFGDIYAKSFYMLGKIYQEKGWQGKAIEHYQKFLDLWKDADPGIAEVKNARERLAGLIND